MHKEGNTRNLFQARFAKNVKLASLMQIWSKFLIICILFHNLLLFLLFAINIFLQLFHKVVQKLFDVFCLIFSNANWNYQLASPNDFLWWFLFFLLFFMFLLLFFFTTRLLIIILIISRICILHFLLLIESFPPSYFTRKIITMSCYHIK